MLSLLFLLPLCAYAPPSISNSTGSAALAYTPCGRASGARHGTMVTATALYAFYTPVTAVDRHEVYLRRYESPAATITITTAKYTPTTAWFSTSPFSTCTSTYPNTCFTADICFSTTIHLLPQHERFQSFNFIMDPEVAERWLVHYKSTITSKKTNFSKSLLQSTRSTAQIIQSHILKIPKTTHPRPYPRGPRTRATEYTHKRKKRERAHGSFLQTAEYPDHFIAPASLMMP